MASEGQNHAHNMDTLTMEMCAGPSSQGATLLDQRGNTYAKNTTFHLLLLLFKQDYDSFSVSIKISEILQANAIYIKINVILLHCGINPVFVSALGREELRSNTSFVCRNPFRYQQSQCLSCHKFLHRFLLSISFHIFTNTQMLCYKE